MASLRVLCEFVRYYGRFKVFNQYLNKRKNIHQAGLYISVGYLLSQAFLFNQ